MKFVVTLPEDLLRVREHLFVRRFRALQAEIVPYAWAQGIVTDEDVFREMW
jgi:hypothetical protein